MKKILNIIFIAFLASGISYLPAMENNEESVATESSKEKALRLFGFHDGNITGGIFRGERTNWILLPDYVEAGLQAIGKAPETDLLIIKDYITQTGNGRASIVFGPDLVSAYQEFRAGTKEFRLLTIGPLIKNMGPLRIPPKLVALHELGHALACTKFGNSNVIPKDIAILFDQIVIPAMRTYAQKFEANEVAAALDYLKQPKELFAELYAWVNSVEGGPSLIYGSAIVAELAKRMFLTNH